jgi:hypothetical protein
MKLDLNNIFFISSEIDKMVEDMDIDYIDACLLYCERNELEVEYVGDIIKNNQNILGKIQKEAEDLNYLQKESRLLI